MHGTTDPADLPARHPTKAGSTSRPRPDESPRMFESDLLDAFSRVPYWVVPMIYVPIVAALLAWGAFAGMSGTALGIAFAGGWLVWSLMEYWLHRTLFHWEPKASWGPAFHFVLHGVHHQWYQDRFRLVMPPAVSLFVGVVVLGSLEFLAWAARPVISEPWVPGVFAGIVFGYLVYDMIHYAVHHMKKPNNRVLLALRAHHNKHHHNARFKDKKFGVSSTLWDHVFGTYE